MACKLGSLAVARGIRDLVWGALLLLPTLTQSSSTFICLQPWTRRETSLENRVLLLVWHFWKRPAGVVGAESRPEQVVLCMLEEGREPEATMAPVLYPAGPERNS